MWLATYYAGKPHVQFERRTVASVRATLCATSDPTEPQLEELFEPSSEVGEGDPDNLAYLAQFEQANCGGLKRR
jgi:hypothetical protein